MRRLPNGRVGRVLMGAVVLAVLATACSTKTPTAPVQVPAPVISAVVANFTGISALTVGARVGGFVNIYFTADCDFGGTPDLEGFFCLSVQVDSGPAVALDIQPGSCPNSFNRQSNGVLPRPPVGPGLLDVKNV